MCSSDRSHVRNSSDARNVQTSPAMIATGRLVPPPAAPAAKTIGSTGYAHGEMTVTIPARTPTP